MKEYILLGILTVLLTSCPLTGDADNYQQLNYDNVDEPSFDKTDLPDYDEGRNYQYETVEIETNYRILPYPDLKYEGLIGETQQFISTLGDQTFAIYTSKTVNRGRTFEQIKQSYESSYGITCEEFEGTGWLTQSRNFMCYYYDSTRDITYKMVIFSKNDEYIYTYLGVWGTSLGNYEYTFDDFNMKAVDWN